jgi:hypothetical protein
MMADRPEPVSKSEVSIVRRALAQLSGVVSRTWFEWTIEGSHQVKTLVVEVIFDTDPSSSGFDPVALERIERVARETLTDRTTMIVSRLKIVPRSTTIPVD